MLQLLQCVSLVYAMFGIQTVKSSPFAAFQVHETFGVIEKVPRVGGRELDLGMLYRNVTSLGGCERVIHTKNWREAAESFNFPETITSVSFSLRKAYFTFLWDYEQVRSHAFVSFLFWTCSCIHSFIHPSIRLFTHLPVRCSAQVADLRTYLRHLPVIHAFIVHACYSLYAKLYVRQCNCQMQLPSHVRRV